MLENTEVAKKWTIQTNWQHWTNKGKNTLL